MGGGDPSLVDLRTAIREFARVPLRSEDCEFDLRRVVFLQDMRIDRSLQLADAARQRLFVRLRQRFEKSPICGYVIEVGPKWCLLALVSGGVWLDGYQCFRIQDIKSVGPDPYADFAEAALRKRGERQRGSPCVSVARIEDLLLTANRAFPLVTIHREEVDPDACWIGRVLGIKRGRLSLLEINPDASWDEKPHSYRLSQISRVDFGGDYEDALHLVGGNPPAP